MELGYLSIEELQRKIQQTLIHPDSYGKKRMLSRYVNALRRKGCDVSTSNNVDPTTGRSYDTVIFVDVVHPVPKD